jgi:hypothetical protein
MAKKKKNDKSLIDDNYYDIPKPRINNKTIEAMRIIVNDPGLARLGKCEMESIIDAYKAGKRSK